MESIASIKFNDLQNNRGLLWQDGHIFPFKWDFTVFHVMDPPFEQTILPKLPCGSLPSLPPLMPVILYRYTTVNWVPKDLQMSAVRW